MDVEGGELWYFVVGDAGSNNPSTRALARAMDSFAATHPPQFIMSVGDNFYPSGVSSVDDRKFVTCWKDLFLCYPSLRVPWKYILGNHDYEGDPLAQIEFTTCDFNMRECGGLFQLPSKNYHFDCRVRAGPAGPAFTASFFGLDTSACQDYIRFEIPKLVPELHGAVASLRGMLAECPSDYKIMFGHHPSYTKGSLHGEDGVYLRSERFMESGSREVPGFDLDRVMEEGGVSTYFAGHEHVFQAHYTRGVQHVVCGASGAMSPSFYGGPEPSTKLDWVDSTMSTGFLAVCVTATKMRVQVIRSSDAEILSDIVVPRQGLPRPSRKPSASASAGASASASAKVAAGKGSAVAAGSPGLVDGTLVSAAAVVASVPFGLPTQVIAVSAGGVETGLSGPPGGGGGGGGGSGGSGAGQA